MGGGAGPGQREVVGDEARGRTGTSGRGRRRPEGWSTPGPPDGARLVRQKTVVGVGGRAVDVTIAFHRRAAELQPTAADARWLAGLGPLGRLAASGRRSRERRHRFTDPVRAAAPGVVDVKVAALDLDWSGLKFVWRRDDRRTARPTK